MLRRRAAGILLHVTSLPSRYGIGDLGPEACRFVDFLAEAHQSYWQILPVTYSSAAAAYSPYDSFSAWAGNPLLISPDVLCRQGLLRDADLADVPVFPDEAVDFRAVHACKQALLRTAFSRFAAESEPVAFDQFVTANAGWLEDFALFMALKHRHGRQAWCDWPAPLRDRHPDALAAAREELREPIQYERFVQYIFYRQYAELKAYCDRRGVGVIGDVPIYVNHDSADVWAHPAVFKLDDRKRPTHVAGVPPDYFSRTGQLWGNPVYDWDSLATTGFAWWMARLRHNLRLFDCVRIDHFRGLVAYWEVPAGRPNAIEGRWVEAPSTAFFRELFKQMPFAPILAEDLGHITPDVREIIRRFEFPGMRVLQFAFGGDAMGNPHRPYRYPENAVVYTGTHDNNTMRGWFETNATMDEKNALFAYLGREVSSQDIAWEMIRLATASVAHLAIVPMQDVLNLGAEARMNHPGRRRGNWRWRMRPDSMTPTLARSLRELVDVYGRG